MRAAFVGLAAALAVKAIPSSQVRLGNDISSLVVNDDWEHVITGAETFLGDVVHNTHKAANAFKQSVKHDVETWFDAGREFIKQHNVVCAYTSPLSVRRPQWLTLKYDNRRRADHAPRVSHLPDSSQGI